MQQQQEIHDVGDGQKRRLGEMLVPGQCCWQPDDVEKQDPGAQQSLELHEVRIRGDGH
jgi:hypothetical protein